MSRPARKHGIGVARILYVIAHTVPTANGDALIYIGVDDRGVELEVITVPDNKNPAGRTVIHAMPRAYRRG